MLNEINEFELSESAIPMRGSFNLQVDWFHL
jgi:hypothetical protein